MQKNFTLLAFFVMAGLGSSSQLIAKKSTKNFIRCYTVERINEIKKSKPSIETDAQFENWMGQKIKDRKQSGLQRPLAGNYIIPVVFHIIHNGEAAGTSSNLSAAYIQQQLLQLNKDFANVSNSQYGVSAASGIQFVLAQKDPTNNILAEPGIDRIDRNAKSWTDYSTTPWTMTYVDAIVKPNSTWNSSNYYNIWVIPELTTGTNTILGYATFPSSSTLSGLNNSETAISAGVVILTATVGSTFFPFNCNFEYGSGKTLAHETGHFLGLRHIWGDANCGNDFCNDTPIHQEANYGKPSHPKSNSCGTADEMFENYMDYCDDEVLNTFTANQVDRMQTVMVNSPRRASLAISNVGAVAPVGGNQISFTLCSGALNISEAGVVGTSPRYKDVNLTLNVDDKATGNATVNISVTGNAVNNFHYQLLTPVLNYVAGDQFKNVRIRVFDNAEVDGPKTLKVNYAISGTGVIAGTSANEVNISISDNDFVVLGSSSTAIYSEDFGITGGFFPAGGWLGGSFASPAGPNVWRVGSSGGADITDQALYITNNTAKKTLAYTPDEVSDAVVVTPKITTKGYTNATLSFTYKCNGEKDADGTFDFGSLMYSFNNSTFFPLADNLGNPYVYVSTPAATSSGNISLPGNLQDTSFAIAFRWKNDDNTGNNPPFLVDDILVNATPYQVETGIGNSYGFDIRSGAAVNNFKSATDKVIATVRNVSASLSGVTAQITQTGTGNIAFNTSQGTYLRTQKVFQISPTVANTTATYQATLYFTTAELAIWGADRLNLRIMKVKDGVSLGSVLNSSNAELITPTVVENVVGGFIAYTGNFTGFSQFILVAPLTVLPVSLVSFQATAADNNIQLVWRTSQENNNRGFQVERSLDGINFKQIGWVNGNGTTSLTSTYNFTDNFVQSNITYYYRILQVDIDNRQVYSQVRNARLKATAGIRIAVNPNPAKDFVNLLISGSSNRASIELLNAAGQKLLQRTDVNTSNGVYNLPLPVLSKGIYTIMVYLPEGAFAKKIIIQ